METLQDLVESLKERGSKTSISWKENKERKALSYIDLYRRIQNYSRGFLELGAKHGDKVALISRNHPEWITLSLAINNAGLVDVPRGENSDVDELDYIIEHSSAKIVIVDGQSTYEKVAARPHKDLKHIISIEALQNLKSVSEIERIGKDSGIILPKVSPYDLASIIYTSGTTGRPKGVMLTHSNFASNCEASLKRMNVSERDKFVSILPAWHVFERIAKYASLACGSETFYSTQKSLMQDLLAQRPTVIASVPRIWEMVYKQVMKKADKGPLKNLILKLALEASIDYARSDGMTPKKIIESIPHHYLDRKLYSELRAKLGNNIRFIISGGGALPKKIDDFYNAAGIEILEGYGMTETSPVIAVREQGKKELNSVGRLLDGIDAKIIDPENGKEQSGMAEGVICVRGPNVMEGYYLDEIETGKVLSNGWLNTGDRGYFNKKGCLVITGREKDIIVLSNGENINPNPIEEELRRSEYIDTAMVTGQDWKCLGALIVPNFEKLKEYCKQNKIQFEEKNKQTVILNDQIRNFYKQEILRYVNSQKIFKSYEKIQDFHLLPEAFSIGKELTATMKIKRRKVEEIYQFLIEDLKKKLNRE